MGILDIFTGNKGVETAEKVLDAGISGIDKIFYTEEEKAEANKKMGDLWLDTQKVLSNESSPRSVTRRIIAWAIILNTMLFADVCLVLAITDRKQTIDRIVDVANAFNLGWAFVVVIGFYFGTHLVSKLK
jgi:hypothetical protein